MLAEKEIIAQLSDASTREQAFTAVVREYQEMLYWQIRRMVSDHDDADDILQNVFVKAWQALDTFRGDSQIRTWLYRIAWNETINFTQRQRAHISMNILSGDNNDHTMMLESDPYFDGDETQLQLQKAVSALPPKQRQVFILKYFQEMKYEDMSDMLGTSVGALKASYHHAVQKITDFFQKEF